MKSSHAFPLRQAAILLFWMAVWQMAACFIDNSIILVGPAETLQALLRLLPDPEFWLSIAGSFGKISCGFLLALFAGIAAGSAACRFPLLRDFLEPAVTLMKSVPVASFVILALIWTGSQHLAVLISFLVVFPILYVNTLAGLQSADIRLLEMARVFRVRPLRRVRFIYLPALLPYLSGGCRVALGMSWKSGVAAEVIGLPSHSIGEHLYMSKIYLETDGLFAWTIVIIGISVLTERLVLFLLNRLQRKGGAAHAPADS